MSSPGLTKSKRDRAILSTLLYHALRREELCKLNVRDFKHERCGVAHLKVSGKTNPAAKQTQRAAAPAIDTSPSLRASRIGWASLSLACIPARTPPHRGISGRGGT
jgi:integrase